MHREISDGLWCEEPIRGGPLRSDNNGENTSLKRTGVGKVCVCVIVCRGRVGERRGEVVT